MKKIFTVNEMSEILNKSTATIYDYLKKGKLKGEKTNGIWTINYDNITVENEEKSCQSTHKIKTEIESNEQTELTKNTETILKTNIKSNKKINDDKSFVDKFSTDEDFLQIKNFLKASFYMRTLKNKFNKYDNILIDMIESLKKEITLNHRLEKVEGVTKFINKLPKTLEQAKAANTTYMYVLEAKNNIEKEVSNLIGNYKEIYNALQDIEILNCKYSNISESAYIYISNKNLVKVLNRLSELNKKFFILNSNVFSNETIKLRFSSHIPDYFTENAATNISKFKEVDILIPYADLEENFNTFKPAEQTEEDKQEIKNINRILNLAKKYSDKPVAKLKINELREYYEISIELQNNNRTKEKGFVKSLKGKQIAIKKQLDKLENEAI